MEGIKISFVPEEFDRVVHDALPEGGDLALHVKRAATVGGRTAVAVTFTVKLTDETVARAQAVTTARAFLAAADALRARLKMEGEVD